MRLANPVALSSIWRRISGGASTAIASSTSQAIASGRGEIGGFAARADPAEGPKP
jgi:hypothetical protein